jgi:hypothetical protein
LAEAQVKLQDYLEKIGWRVEHGAPFAIRSFGNGVRIVQELSEGLKISRAGLDKILPLAVKGTRCF